MPSSQEEFKGVTRAANLGENMRAIPSVCAVALGGSVIGHNYYDNDTR